MRIGRTASTFLRSYHAVVITAAVITVVVLGVLGIDGYCATHLAQCAGWTRADRIYKALQLFSWQSGGEFIGDLPLSLHIARFAAPALLGYAAVLGLRVLFGDQYHLLRARWSRDHVVVCGLGFVGLALTERLHHADTPVVGIELEPHHPGLRTARRVARVVVGNATHAGPLNDAAIARARHVVVVCGDDATNAEVVAKVERLRPPQAPPLPCHMHIANAALCDHVQAREIGSHRGRVRVQFFNADDCAARALAGRVLTAGDAGAATVPPHLLSIGLDAINERLIIHAARNWQLGRTGSQGRLAVTVVDAKATRTLDGIVLRYPQVKEVCDVAAIDVAPDSDQFAAGALVSRTSVAVTYACVSLGNDTATLSCGLALVHDTRDDRFPVTLCAERARGLRLLVGDLGTEHRPDRLRVFDIKEPASAPDLLFGGSKEMLARAIHDGYRRMQERQGHTRETNRALVPWNELPGHLQESNRQQADHVVQKLAAVGCGIVPLSDWNATLVSFTSDEANTMARMEHGDDWESLPEDVKEIDRHTVRDLPRFLALAGFYVYRLAGPDSVVAAGSGVRDLK